MYKKIFLYFSMFLFIFSYCALVEAKEGIEVMDPKFDINSHHDFTIRFSAEVDPLTVINEHVYILHNDEIVFDTKIALQPDKKSIKVSAPPNGYNTGETYLLHIDNQIKSFLGNYLKQPVEMYFTIKGETTIAEKIRIEQLELNREMVTIRNEGSKDVLMNGWKLESEDEGGIFEFPKNFILKGGKAVTITSGSDGFEDRPSHLLWKNSYIWNNEGDRVKLISPKGIVVDETTTTNKIEQAAIEQKKHQELTAMQYSKTLITNNNLLDLQEMHTETGETLKWYGYELKDINLYFTKEALKNHLYLYEYADNIIAEIKEYMGSGLKRKINVFVYDGIPIKGTGNQYIGKKDYVFLNPTGMDGNKVWDVRPIFAHEMVHAFQGHIWGFEKLYPVFGLKNFDGIWLTEGMAEYVSRQHVSYPLMAYPSNLYLRLTHYSKEELDRLLDEFEKIFSMDLQELEGWPTFWIMDYRPYESIVYYLEEVYGRKAFLNWVNEGVKTQNIAAATQSAFGKKEQEIIADWKKYFLIGNEVKVPSELTIGSYLLRQDISEFIRLEPNTNIVVQFNDYLLNDEFKKIWENNQFQFVLTSPYHESVVAYVVAGISQLNGIQLYIPEYHSMEPGIPYTLSYTGKGSTDIKVVETLKIIRQ